PPRATLPFAHNLSPFPGRAGRQRASDLGCNGPAGAAWPKTERNRAARRAFAGRVRRVADRAVRRRNWTDSRGAPMPRATEGSTMKALLKCGLYITLGLAPAALLAQEPQWRPTGSSNPAAPITPV